MAVLRKQSFPENLETFWVLVNDTTENSIYFKITELPDTFTGGKNSFLIQGSEDLVQDTIVKVEIKDANGNVIYTEPGEGIPEYYEGTSKPVAVYVYPDTAYGPCTITVLGELAEYVNERGVKTGVPAEWRNKYNIRWQKIINVNPNLTNTSKIRFYRRPKVNITEIILPIYNRSVSRVIISGSINGLAIEPTVGSNFRTFRGNTLYYLYTTSSMFSSSMEGENISITGLPQSYITTIKDVVDSKKVIVTTPYYQTSSNLPTSYQIVTNFESGSFTLGYDSNISLSNSTIDVSYAKIKLTDLEAFSGDPARLKIFSKRKADIGNYSLIEDIRLESSELLLADEYSGSINVSTGQFTKQSIIDDYWSYTDINGNSYTKMYDNNLLASSVKLIDGNIINSSEYPQRIFYYKTTLEFNKNTEYEIDFIPYLSSSTFLPSKLEVYGSGSAFSNSNIITELGKKITEFEFSGNTRRYDRQQIIFKPESDGTGTIVFAVYQGNWQISNISLRASSESNFSPNEITLNVEVPTVVKNDEYEFRFEFYDVNNNYVPVNVVTSSVFTGGTTPEDIGRVKFLKVTPDSNVFPFGYLNNYDFQELNTFSSVPLGTTDIIFNIQYSDLTGSITFASSAYDSGGLYIEPSTYVGQYPGFLTNVTTASAILDVANFTGSMASTIEVRKIEYTASWDGLTDIVSIYKVVEGTPGSDGENGEQYIIKPINGTAIKNSDPNAYLEVQLVKIFGNAALDIVAGDVKLVTGSLNTVITSGNGIVAGTNGLPYNARFYAQKIDGLLEVKAYDFINNRIVDTISLADVTDGLTTGFIEATNGLLLNRDPNNSTYTPTDTALTASFYDGLGNLYTSSVLITPNYSNPNDQLKYQTGLTNPNINLDFVRTTTGVSVSNNTFVNTKGLTFKYTFTDPNTGGTVSATEGVAITLNGSSGTSGAAGSSGTSGIAGSSGTSGFNGANISIIVTPPAQTVNVTTAAVYDTPVDIVVRVTEDGVLYNYDGTPAYGNSTFRITNIVNGTNISVDGTTSGSITPTTPNTTAGIVTTFDIIYQTSNGLTSNSLPQTHIISVALVGQTGPGVVFTGVWEAGRAYQYSDSRRDVVLWSTSGLEPYDTYYIVTSQHTSTNDTNPSTGKPGFGPWQSLGTEDFFVAAKIAIFEESFIKNTLNIGSSNNGGISSANITIFGSGSYPYISLGQSSDTGSQGYGINGIFLGAVNDSGIRKYKFSIVTGSSYLKWDGDGRLLISGTVSASEGRIGGVTISDNKLYAGAGTYNDAATGFYLASSSTNIFSLGDKLSWNGSTLSVNGTINITNTSTANNGGPVGSFSNGDALTAGSIGGVTIGSTKIYIGTGTWANKNTPFYVDNTGKFSLEDKLVWDPTTEYLNISGTIKAETGSFGGIIIGADKIYTGTGNWAEKTTGFYADSSGKFSLEDKLVWDSVNNYLNISGTIKAETGSFGGITIGADKIYTGVGTFGNTTTGFYADSTGQFSLKDRLTWNGSVLFVSGTINAAGGNFTGDISSSANISGSNLIGGTLNIGNGVFLVDAQGDLTAQSATIYGFISSSAGRIGGWEIDEDSLTSSGSIIRLDSNRNAISIYSGSSIAVDINGSSQLAGLVAGTATFTPATITSVSSSTTSQTVVFPTAHYYNAPAIIKTQTLAQISSASFNSSTSGSYALTFTLFSETGDDTEIMEVDWQTAQNNVTSYFLQATIGAYIRTGSPTGTTIATLGSGYTLSGNPNNKLGSATRTMSQVFTTTINTSPSTTYYIVPYITPTAASINRASTLTETQFNTTVRYRTPKLKDISFIKSVSKSELVAGGFQVIRDTSNFVKIDRLASGTMLEVGGSITATGNITAYSSDARLKKNVIKIENSLDKIQKISGVHYDWIDGVENVGFVPYQKSDTGVLAQEIYEVLPDAVKPAPFDSNTDGSSKSGQNYLTVQYEKIVPLLIEAIKELKKEIDILKNKL